ncbi:MAG TPA: hypothetical protein VGB46_03535 [Flavisolibacter sp.]
MKADTTNKVGGRAWVKAGAAKVGRPVEVGTAGALCADEGLDGGQRSIRRAGNGGSLNGVEGRDNLIGGLWGIAHRTACRKQYVAPVWCAFYLTAQGVAGGFKTSAGPRFEGSRIGVIEIKDLKAGTFVGTGFLPEKRLSERKNKGCEEEQPECQEPAVLNLALTAGL